MLRPKAGKTELYEKSIIQIRKSASLVLNSKYGVQLPSGAGTVLKNLNFILTRKMLRNIYL